MHVRSTDGNAVTRIEVVARAETHHESKGEILSLPIENAMRSLSVNEPGSSTRFKIWCCPPVAMDEVTAHSQIESPIPCFRSSRDRSEGQGRCKIGVAAQDPRAIDFAHVPSNRRKYRYESVMERILLVIVAYEGVENKRNIDGEHSHFLGEFQLVSVIDVVVEISLLRRMKVFDRSFSCFRVFAHRRNGLCETSEKERGQTYQDSIGHLYLDLPMKLQGVTAAV